MSVEVFGLDDTQFRKIRASGSGIDWLDNLVPYDPVPPITRYPNRDISTVWNTDLSHGDYRMEGSVIQSGNDLDTALIISLFTDRLAAADDRLPDGGADRRGWWGDTGETFPIGSRLWLLDRSKLSKEVPLRCENYIKEALQWMLADGVAAKIEVEAIMRAPTLLAARVQVFRKSGASIARNYAWVWRIVS